MSFDAEASSGDVELDGEITPESVYERVAEIYAETVRAKQREDELAGYRLAELDRQIVRSSGSGLDHGIVIKLSVILPQLLERIEQKKRGEDHLAVKPVDVIPTGNLFADTIGSFASALIIAARANDQTFTGRFNTIEIVVAPESAREDIVEQYEDNLATQQRRALVDPIL